MVSIFLPWASEGEAAVSSNICRTSKAPSACAVAIIRYRFPDRSYSQEKRSDWPFKMLLKPARSSPEPYSSSQFEARHARLEPDTCPLQLRRAAGNGIESIATTSLETADCQEILALDGLATLSQ